ncbi:MAG: tryptophan synthase subunit alpha [Candidatus Bathyarchaeia archaeon]
MSEISKVFQRLKAQQAGALIGYVTGGDPAPRFTPAIAEALIKGGVDILELGVPFSDPIADGPTIQAATVRALRAGTTPKTVLELAEEIKRRHGVPIVLLTYFNPVFRMGTEKFFQLAKNAGVDGVVVPDLPIEESTTYCETARRFGVDTIFLAAPSTSNERLSKIVTCTSGFLYLVSHFGVTGAREALEESTVQLIKRILPYTAGRVPLAVGFGVSKSEHVRRIIQSGADGVIVGSAFVNIIHKYLGDASGMLKELETLARELKEAQSEVDKKKG